MQPRTELTRAPETEQPGRPAHQAPAGEHAGKTKRSLPSLLTGVVLAVILLLYMVTYQVRFTEVAVVRTFGKIDQNNIKTEPGLYWKWPFPIQRVQHFDNRLQVTSTVGEENPTADGKNIIVTTAINWRIEDPYRFSIRCTSMEDAENKLKARVRNDQKTVISRYAFSQFVSNNPEELLYDKITSEIEEAVRNSAKELYGIEVATVRLESIALPQRITENVFEAMKKERQTEAARYTSEGESAAQLIKDTAEKIAGTIRSFAESEAEKVVAEGYRRALEYNKVLAQDEELATFLLLIRNLPEILKDRTTVILEADSAGFTPLVSDTLALPVPAPASQPARVDATTNVQLPQIIERD
ncbi:MAG TPA: protease modulator HflC [Phycisphaerae bacterium]|nr:protease modulator HflC [Phycisphaerae bacterium]HOJ75652.1 protease modulator HflC [Phycisphaerae bacterium]HOM52520.1 protease modulator HflC [Phycisphaerae bacterium]HON66835.1 protease modulator HflC [Phycisphaerae bacterium]HOQ87720.1 protease modulator HflC [Phycisphaerae bacterium]